MSGYDFNNVREAIRYFMAKKGMKPTPLSLSIGNSKSLIKDILDDGQDIRLSTLARIAEALEVELEDLLIFPNVRVPDKVTTILSGMTEENLDLAVRLLEALPLRGTGNAQK